MARFPYIRLPGLWVPTTVLTAEEMAQSDEEHVNSINGDGGGTWAPAAPIIIGGAGLSVTGPLAASNVAQITLAAGVHYGVSSRQITRVLGLHVKALGNSPQLLGWEVADNWADLSQSSTSSVQNLIFELDDIPHGSVLNEVALWVEGATGHTSVTSSISLPSITLRIAAKTGVGTTGGSTSDGSATTSAYESGHDIRISGLSLAIDRSINRYALSMTPETGANSVAGLSIYAVEVVYTITSLPE